MYYNINMLIGDDIMIESTTFSSQYVFFVWVLHMLVSASFITYLFYFIFSNHFFVLVM